MEAVTLSLHSHYEAVNVLAEAAVHAVCHTFNGSHFLHSSQVSRIESCTVETKAILGIHMI
jgi:hypothetical protein